MNIKAAKQQEKIKYKEVVELAKKAEKQAAKFINGNMKLDPRLKLNNPLSK